ncbi:MAG: VOC family protein [Actinomycetota bacterium]|nr:VOC family protein [Actinomycetota bacterium]
MPDKTSYLPGEPIWTDLATPDMDSTVAFYSGLFGWEFGGGDEEFGGYGMFTKDGKNVAGVVPVMFPGQPAVWTSYITSDDADKTAAVVAENGGTVLAAPMDVADLGRMAVLADPVGAAFGIWQPGTMTGAEVIGDEGTFNWTELATRDRAAAVPFYTTLFGWSAGGGAEYTEFEVNGQPVAGCMDMPEMVPAEVPSYWMPYFAAEDPAAKAQHAASLGATVLVPYMEVSEVAFSVVQDPNGSTFGLLKVSS